MPRYALIEQNGFSIENAVATVVVAENDAQAIDLFNSNRSARGLKPLEERDYVFRHVGTSPTPPSREQIEQLIVRVERNIARGKASFCTEVYPDYSTELAILKLALSSLMPTTPLSRKQIEVARQAIKRFGTVPWADDLCNMALSTLTVPEAEVVERLVKALQPFSDAYGDMLKQPTLNDYKEAKAAIAAVRKP